MDMKKSQSEDWFNLEEKSKKKKLCFTAMACMGGKIINLAEAVLSCFVRVLQVSQCLMWNLYLVHICHMHHMQWRCKITVSVWALRVIFLTCTTCSVKSPCLSGPYSFRKTKSSFAPSGAASCRKPGFSKPSRALNRKPLRSLPPSPSFSNRMRKTSAQAPC